MSGGRVGNMIRGNTLRWESELWSYISNGDGKNCPLYSNCLLRQEGQGCISDNKELFDQLLGSEQFDASRYNFVECVTLGRVFELAEKLAQSLLKERRIHRLPVPAGLVSLADEAHPIEVRLVPLQSYHGALWYLNDSWIIQLNENDTRAVKRFTLLHEAFHIIAHCHCTNVPVFRKSRQDRGVFNEVLAEYFAICTLMPREWVMKKWAETKDLDRMVEIFSVTKPAMWFRLKCLHLI